MKFSGLACLDINNVCGKFRCKQQVREKLSRWCLYTSIHTRHIKLNDAYMHRSTPCAFEHMTHICVIQHQRC